MFVGSILTLNATAIDPHASDAHAPITLEAFMDGDSLGTSENGTWTLQANAVGNYTFTVNATGEGGEATSRGIEVEVLPLPIAAWDFDTTTSSVVPLGTVIQSARKYPANFGSGNLTFSGAFTTSNSSNRWSHQNGEIWVGSGTPLNAVAEMLEPLTNQALLLRGGKNIGAEGKSLVFEFSMVGRSNLNVSYSATGDPTGEPGFTAHVWEYSSDGETWRDLQPVVVPTGQASLSNPAGYARVELPEFSDLADKEQAYLRVRLTGATAASGVNLIDNIILAAEPVSPPSVEESFTVLERSAATLYMGGGGPSKSPVDPSELLEGSESSIDLVSCEPTDHTDSDALGWVVVPPAIHEMVVHAEVVDGSQFLTAPGSLLSATEEGKVLGLAEPIPQTTRYELGITSADPNPEPLRLKVYDAATQGILVLDEKVPFTAGGTIGSPSVPKRYRVAYEEVEQVVEVAPGWNTFTTAVNPDPATLAGALADYDASEGDRLLGPAAEAAVVDGQWTPAGFTLDPEATYSLLRQASNASQIILKGKALDEAEPAEPAPSPASHYGQWINLPPDAVTTADWVDSDNDGIDDRRQPGPGQPIPDQKKPEKSAALGTSSGSNSGSSHAHGSHAASPASSEKSSKKSKPSKKSKSTQKSKDSEKKKSGKKKKNRG